MAAADLHMVDIELNDAERGGDVDGFSTSGQQGRKDQGPAFKDQMRQAHCENVRSLVVVPEFQMVTAYPVDAAAASSTGGGGGGGGRGDTSFIDTNNTNEKTVGNHSFIGRHKTIFLVAFVLVVLIVVTVGTVCGTTGSCRGSGGNDKNSSNNNNANGGGANTNYCGTTFSGAGDCQAACPGGLDLECPNAGEKCFSAVTVCAGNDNNDATAATRFCGTTFVDAAQSCQQACPNGRDGECPNGQACFADITTCK